MVFQALFPLLFEVHRRDRLHILLLIWQARLGPENRIVLHPGCIVLHFPTHLQTLWNPCSVELSDPVHVAPLECIFSSFEQKSFLSLGCCPPVDWHTRTIP